MSIIYKLPYEALVGLRYTRAGKRSGRNRFISFISMISVAGIALGVAALIVVLSVMNGFQKEVTDRMLSVLAHIEVYDVRGAMPDWRAVERAILRDPARNPNVVAAAPFADVQGMLLRDGVMKPVLLRGILPAEEGKVSEVARQMRQGSLDKLASGSMNVVLGSALAKSLEVTVGERVTMLLGSAGGSAAPAAPRTQTFTVVGIFEAGHYEFDSTLAFAHLDDAVAAGRIDGPAGVRLRLRDMHQAPQVAAELRRGLGEDVVLRDWSQVNTIWFAAVQSQKRMMFIILAMIIAVAAFNLVSTLVMTVKDKQSDIAILRTLGASPRSIMKIFIVQGTLVGLLGSALGVLLGVTVALNVDVIVPAIERVLGIQFLSKEIYLISEIPSELRWPDVTSIGGLAVLLAFLATLYPSWKAARINPAQALRYE
ncbi:MULTISPECIES: lipoprotein-releasing ABC transporter permease subunit [unclassified Massilia]|uniref:lipoprotein-releasing ABC transporter permease subunit n=1 Tax=unclassified Massilia TaxID=2609279 RepID=UPI001785E993|nr:MULTISPECIES: lipoprotein-releasing ABC transporter permease subunit [unclassified Massilia]MBD8529426.1 lipoprotein-releasing ABC transporter permease subunit [Massilia sp. CFBP 13647]MBD8672819.1 lipoprotein-releasing ABC transporter permease subunit [Massilia sp. CFBP 13721]